MFTKTNLIDWVIVEFQVAPGTAAKCVDYFATLTSSERDAAEDTIKETSDEYGILNKYLKDEDEIINWLRHVNLPCWFANSYKVKYSTSTSHYTCNEKHKKVIQIYEKKNYFMNKPLISKSEDHYEEGDVLDDNCSEVRDFGIFARLTRGDSRFLIMSGIHQFGTWIIADYFKKLLIGEIKSEESEIFNSGQDFIAIMSGVYQCKIMKIQSSGIYDNYFWTKSSGGDFGEWKLVG